MLNAPVLKDIWQRIVLPIVDEYCKEKGLDSIGNIKVKDMQKRVPILLEDIADGAARIKNIVDDLKDFARQDTSDLDYEIDINDVIKASVTLVHSKIKHSTERFDVQYGESIPVIKGNFQRLEQVVVNLLINACDALANKKDGVTLSTSFDKNKEKVIIVVRDEGCGIPPEGIDKVTDPFYTTKRDIGGTGLGLSISAGIIASHQGTMTFDSPPGKGTSVIVELPALKHLNKQDK